MYSLHAYGRTKVILAFCRQKEILYYFWSQNSRDIFYGKISKILDKISLQYKKVINKFSGSTKIINLINLKHQELQLYKVCY